MPIKGRPRKTDDEKFERMNITLSPERKKELMDLSENMRLKPSSVISYLIKIAKKDKVLRNIIVNNKVADLKASGALAWETNQAPGYHTIRRKDGSLYTYFKPDEEITVDQRIHDNTEEVSNEEIDFLYISLGYKSKEEFIEIYGQDAYDRRMYQQSHQVNQDIP